MPQKPRNAFTCVDDLSAFLSAWVLGLGASTDMPVTAAAALANGFDSPSLRRLAGLSGHSTSEALDLFERAIAELGLAVPDKRTAARQYAIYVSRLILTGRVSPALGAKAVWRASLSVGEPDFHDLDPFIYASSEHDDRPADRVMFETAICEEAKKWASRVP